MSTITNRSFKPFESVKADLWTLGRRGSPQDRALAEMDATQLLRQIAYANNVNLALQSLNLSFTPVAIAIPITSPATLIIPAAQFPRGYRLFNADTALNAANANALFLGGSEVTTLNGYPLPAGQERVIFLRENVAVYAISITATVSIRILQLQ